MHSNIEEYRKKYINTYSLYNSNIVDKKISSVYWLNFCLKKNYLFLFLLSIIIISFGFYVKFVNEKISNYKSQNQFYYNSTLDYNDNLLSSNLYQISSNNNESKIINNLYSEKYTDLQNNNSNFSEYNHLNELTFLGLKLKNQLSYNIAQNKTPKIKEFLTPNWQKNYSLKKREFIKTLLPLIAYQNQKISFERKSILRIKDSLLSNKTLNEKDFLYIKNISEKYSVEFDKKHKIDSIEELLIKVDLIPPSIVLAQAANESGWGKSRFAKEYNALFGQYTYDENNGVVPFKREEGKKHLIRNFTSIDKSVEAYFMNLNSHYSYKDFRNSRKKYRDSPSLVKYLTKDLEVYAEDENYVNTINSIIKTNNFKIFDDKILLFVNS